MIKGFREMEVFVKQANTKLHKFHEENKKIFKRFYNVGVLRNIMLAILEEVEDGFDYLPVQLMYFINVNETKKSNPITNISLYKALESFQYVMKSRPKKALKNNEPEKAKQLEEQTQIFLKALKKVGL